MTPGERLFALAFCVGIIVRVGVWLFLEGGER